jgi:hypothetical protein
VDIARVAASLPHGRVAVRAVKGGLDVPGAQDDPAVIATAAIAVSLPLG